MLLNSFLIISETAMAIIAAIISFDITPRYHYAFFSCSIFKIRSWRVNCSIPMMTVPDDSLTSYNAILEKSAIASAQRAAYKKWLRYFRCVITGHFYFALTPEVAGLDYLSDFV